MWGQFSQAFFVWIAQPPISCSTDLVGCKIRQQPIIRVYNSANLEAARASSAHSIQRDAVRWILSKLRNFFIGWNYSYTIFIDSVCSLLKKLKFFCMITSSLSSQVKTWNSFFSCYFFLFFDELKMLRLFVFKLR